MDYGCNSAIDMQPPKHLGRRGDGPLLRWNRQKSTASHYDRLSTPGASGRYIGGSGKRTRL
ncbi:hypothetical protein TSMEX_006732 [Taenia solium]|eukprot:TsM_001213300 transcript=TsM_001213300 gene=TsM_001213300